MRQRRNDKICGEAQVVGARGRGEDLEQEVMLWKEQLRRNGEDGHNGD